MFSGVFEFHHLSLRGHTQKLFKRRSKLEVRRNFFSQRIVDKWNKLPQEVIDSPSTNAFKNRYDKFYRKDMSI